ncbi:HNH endonuclease family protein [Paeniglutamicibacter sp. MACA_103]|uniref:HNH endonuclease family protein n=1 Tax=Paeniglutamicibacter sp. MACA_103 TaxID=3377337 RepID=UPI00389559C3
MALTACVGAGSETPAVAAPVIWSEAPSSEALVIWSEAPTPQPTPTADEPTPEPSVEATRAPVETTKSAAPAPATSAAPSVKAGPSTAKAGTTLNQLPGIPVKGRAPKTGYERSLFGSGWKDPDRNGCDARNDMLRRDLTGIAVKPGTNGCVVTSGVLSDPFTGKRIDFVRGQGTSTKVQIDHVVALSDAWQKGAQKMTEEQRVAFANDPLNLLAVDGPSNASKGDSDAASWLPPNKSFRCSYVARQTAVKAKHGLWMTKAEHEATKRIITTQCPNQAIPAG